MLPYTSTDAFAPAVFGAQRRSASHAISNTVVLVAAVLLTLAASIALAQEPTAAPLEGDDVVEGVVEGVPMTFSVGLQGGLPGYRYASVVGAVRTDIFGVAVRVGYGTVGLSGGAQLRLYPPLPLPLPAYVGLGLDVYSGNSAFHLALGTHVPLGQRVRLDLEGGVARSSTLLGTLWSPYASIGVSYAFPIAVDPSADPRDGPEFGARRGTATCDAEPDPDAVPDGVDAAVRSFVRDGQALYGASYRSLRYRYRITGTDVTDGAARATVAYGGSAVEVLTGNVIEASGVATVDLRWNGCRWVATSIDY